MKRVLLSFALVVGAQLGAADAWAWGDEGHEIVGLIAEHYLTPSVHDKVVALLASDPDTLTAHATGDAMADQATWADKYRDQDHRRLHYRQTRNWHFVDIELSASDLDAACFHHPALAQGQPASAGPAEDCAADKIEQFALELSDPNTAQAEKVLALRFILHFVGDLHQPLHAADDHDQGGNAKSVESASLGSGELHGFWDVQFVQRLGTDPKAVADGLIAKIGDADRAAWAQGTPADWAMQSFALAKAFAYGPLPPPDGQGTNTLDDRYADAASGVAAQQLSKAGVRLAMVLNRALQ